MDTSASPWHPVVPSEALRAGENIIAGFIHGEELALWRSDAGVVQAWENRCPHRGTRLTVGRILDGRLSCSYHGWEFEADSGRCVAIPAHPEMPAPRNVCVRTWRAAEARGMVWIDAGGASAQEAPAQAPAAEPVGFFCRSLGLRVPAQAVRDVLVDQGFRESMPCVWRGEIASLPSTLYLTDAQPHLSFLHAWLNDAPAPPARVRQALTALRQLRASIESAEPATA